MAEAKPVEGIPARQARVFGRIAASRSKSSAQGKLFFTLLRLPAADAYSSPATVEIQSSERLGGADEEVSVVVEIGGYPRSYSDKEGGQVRTAENVLRFVRFA